MKIYFIRHLKTEANFQKKYIGKTDQSLFEPENQTLLKNLPLADVVYSSPMKRCLETSKLLFPSDIPVIIDDFREIDFGDFENKSYDQLKTNADYISFLNGNENIPNGENLANFKKRCIDAFFNIIVQSRDKNIIYIICHGGTIMSIMEHFEKNKKGFFEYHIENGCGYKTQYCDKTNEISIIKELS